MWICGDAISTVHLIWILTYMQWWLAAPRCLDPTPHGTETHADASKTRWPDKRNTYFKSRQTNIELIKQKILSLTCTMLLMTIGNMLRGKRRMLNRARDTNAFCASRTLCSSTNTYTANVERATFRKTANVRNSRQRNPTEESHAQRYLPKMARRPRWKWTQRPGKQSFSAHSIHSFWWQILYLWRPVPMRRVSAL